jgi:hypothetical protein
MFLIPLAHRAHGSAYFVVARREMRLCSLPIHCSLRSLRRALVARCLPYSLRSLVQDSGAPAWLSTAGARFADARGIGWRRDFSSRRTQP